MVVDAVVERKQPDLPRFVVIPAAAARALGAEGTTLVECRIGATIRRRTLKEWDAERWFVELPADWCAEAGVDVGDAVSIAIELADDAPPTELVAALAADPVARARFDALPAAHRREWSEHVRAAKRPETRVRRAEGAVARLREG